jgi:hypothetical protein
VTLRRVFELAPVEVPILLLLTNEEVERHRLPLNLSQNLWRLRRRLEPFGLAI